VSSLGDRLYRELVGDRPRPLDSVRDMLDALVSGYGSQRKAAAATGIARKTLYNWSRGVTPTARSMGRLIEEARRARLQPLPSDTAGIDLHVVERRKGRRDGGERFIPGHKLKLRRGTIEAVAKAYIQTGDPEMMAAAFVHGIGDPFYRQWFRPVDGPGPRGPVDAPTAVDSEDEGEELDEAIEELYEEYDGPDYDDSLAYEDAVPEADAESYGFSVV
jgi:hypothetical protein